MEQRYIPKYLDAQPQFLWWEMDEGIILFSPLIVGIMIEQIIMMIVIGIVAQKIYSTLKNAKQQGYMNHLLYALGLYNPKSNRKKKNKIPYYYNKYYVQ